MKFTVSREKLQKALSKVGSILGARSMLPLIGNVMIEAKDGQINLTTTDFELRMSTSIEANVIEEGISTAPGRKLISLVNSFSGAEVEFDVNDQEHFKIVCGSGRFKLLGLPADDFPAQDEFAPLREVKLKECDFKRMIGSISYAVGADDSRKALTGILFSMTEENGLSMVATDSKRMAMQECTPESFSGEFGDAIIPLKAMTELRRLLEGDRVLTVNIGEKTCSFVSENFTLSTKLIEGSYPNYRLVIPTSFKQEIKLPVSVFKSKIETVALVLSESSTYVVLDFQENLLSVAASSSEIGEGCDTMEIEYTGEPFSVSFNPVFLSDPLRNVDADTILFKVNDPLNPVAMETGDGFLYVIMPIRKK
ncbi:MAG: DNA polymerase III subunit beta [Lentisphaeria bacterium]|nr:DNA polymerase III subunit beta [Lentisphaeria bacterium]